MTHFVLLAILALLSGTTSVLAETLRGTVACAVTGEPLYGASVKIAELPGTGAMADMDGHYVITLSRGGRYTVEVTCMGYEPCVMKEILITGTKEVVLNIEMVENSNSLKEVVVRPRVNKETTVNPTVLAGGVMLSMEEATRFAGGYNDPARLVMAFAGVSGESDGSGLSVHGNAPERMQYRIEGVEVFTPNHYNDLWSAGAGLVSALNANVIGNSDFFTSTFNANYSNALSGVFDVRMRPGNNARHEGILQIGTVSEELTLEGPLGRDSRSSYIVNYRYGFTSLVDKLGLVDTEGMHLGFQDFSVKLNFPTRKAGTFSVFALGFIDDTRDDPVALSNLHSAYDASDSEGSMSQLLAGLSHKVQLPGKWTWRTTAAYNMQHISVDNFYYGLVRSAEGVLATPLAYESPQRKYLFSRQKQNEDRLLIDTELSRQLTPRWLTQVGADYSHRFFDLGYRAADRIYAPVTAMQEYTHVSDGTGLASAYWQNLFNVSHRLSLAAGVAASYFLLSRDISVEPRLSLRWQPDHKNSIALGYGLHSMVEKLDAYFYRDADGRLANSNLPLTKAHHLLASYMYRFNDNLNMRFNAYYQYGFDTPVGTGGSTYCVTNRLFAVTDEALTSAGNTRNYGADITLEHYMHHGFYGQTNLSVYKAEYRGENRRWLSQLYDRGFMFKLLGGKEWMVGRQKRDVLNISAKYSIQGGLRYTPIDVAQMNANLDAGIINDTPVCLDDEAFSRRFKPTSIVDLTVSYKINRRRVSHTIAFEGLNILGTKTPLCQRFDLLARSVRTDNTGISLPNIFYRLDF